MRMFRALLALCVLLPAMGLTRLAMWICPEMEQASDEPKDTGGWLDMAYDWERRRH